MKIIQHASLTDLHNKILEQVEPGDIVADFGSGLATYHDVLAEKVARLGQLILVEAHKPYLDRTMARYPAGCGLLITPINQNALEFVEQVVIPSKICIETALAIDFLEHLEEGDAVQLVKSLQKTCKRIVAFVPEGNHPQDKDHYGLGGDHWQTHRSTWHAHDLARLGFTVECWPDFHAGTGGGKDPGALFAVWNR